MSTPSHFEFSFEATPELGPAALKCLLRKRAGPIGPLALILLPLLLLLLASDPAWRPVAGVLAGAALMLLTLFLLAVWQRRRASDRFFRNASSRLVRIAMQDAGVTVSTALGESHLRWTTIERVWKCRAVALLFYQGWQYIAVPVDAIPAGALEFADARIRERTKGTET